MGSSSCPKCGQGLTEGSRFCSRCGTPIGAPVPMDAATQPELDAATDAYPQASPFIGSPNDLTKTVTDGEPVQQAGPPVPGSAPPPAGAPVAAPRAPPRAAATMIGYAPSGEAMASIRGGRAAASAAQPGGPPPAVPPQAGPGPAPQAVHQPGVPRPADPLSSAKRTMLGVLAPSGPSPGQPFASPSANAASPAAGPFPAPGQSPAAPFGAPAQGPAAVDMRKGTMLGVAVPGIAPLAASPAPVIRQGAQGTMMGVAIPGVAPTHGEPASAAAGPASAPMSASARMQPRRAVQIAPMPPPFVDEPDVAPLPTVVKKGLPIALVAGIIGALVAAFGLTAFLLLRSPPLVAQPRLDAQGHEQLHLRCESCQDGTIADLFEARATFKDKEADLTLTTPLKVGNNPLTIHLDRPNLGRDESVQVVVPVAFRIRADLADLSAPKPAITVRVEALPGTDVRVDGKPVTLDASGEGAYAIDIGAETEGATDETRLIDRLIPYALTPRSGQTQSGKLTVRVGIAPLRVDAPSTHAVVEGASFRIAGRTVRGGTVTANGNALHTDPDGTFAQSFDIAAVGDLPVELRVTAPQLAPRTAHWTVKRVEHLADEAKAREQVPELGYDEISADLKGAVGKATIVEGDVVEVRTSAAQTVAVLDDQRSCAHAPCLVRVVYGGDARYKHGDAIRAYGRVTRSVAYGAATVPEVEADFVLLGHAPKR